MRPGPILALVLTFQTSSGSVFESDLWPGEGRPVFAAAAAELRLLEVPSRSARIASTLAVSAGQRVTFDSTRSVTTVPGRLRVLAETVVTGRLLGTVRRLSIDDYYSGRFAPGKVAVSVGQDIEYFQYRAEGTCFVRVVNEVIDADPCPAQDSQHFRTDTQPVVEWWIHLVGDRAGWIEVRETTVRQVDREF